MQPKAAGLQSEGWAAEHNMKGSVLPSVQSGAWLVSGEISVRKSEMASPFLAFPLLHT